MSWGTFPRCAGLLSLTFLPLACGDEGGVPPVEDSLENACQGYVAAACSKLDACAPVLVEVVFGDEPTCRVRSRITCLAGLTAPGTSATVESLRACSDAVGASSCGDLLHGKQPAECVTLPGQVQNGAPCGTSGQCQSTFCSQAGVLACGVCGPMPEPGEPCGSTSCGQELECSQSGQCAAPVAEGGSCDAERPCDRGLSCVGESPSGPGACTKDRTNVGEPCEQEGEGTIHPGCDVAHGLICHPVQNTCVEIEAAAPGEACGVIGSSYRLCRGGGTCTNVDPGTLSGTCKAPAPDGGPCDLAAGPHCLFPARCDGGLCKLPNPGACG